ncbi:MAG: hypothetical protein AUK53_11765 [Betaproteobacteria bacterium CG2_30_59_46]|nr:MAG: hypothetical protein AUK53_11765 [Betaproteobacteria bacterium CG2_30_59_46]
MANSIEVICKSGVFRRAGREFSATPTVVALGDLSKEQLQSLQNEPRLIVREVDANSTDAKQPGKKG